MIKLGSTARRIRESKGLGAGEAASRLGVSRNYLLDVEEDKLAPSTEYIERYRELFGVDIYVLAWCLHGDIESLPYPIRDAAKALSDSWKEELGEIAQG